MELLSLRLLSTVVVVMMAPIVGPSVVSVGAAVAALVGVAVVVLTVVAVVGVAVIVVAVVGVAVGVALDVTLVVLATVGPHALLSLSEGVASIVEHAKHGV